MGNITNFQSNNEGSTCHCSYFNIPKYNIEGQTVSYFIRCLLKLINTKTHHIMITFVKYIVKFINVLIIL